MNIYFIYYSELEISNVIPCNHAGMVSLKIIKYIYITTVNYLKVKTMDNNWICTSKYDFKISNSKFLSYYI